MIDGGAYSGAWRSGRGEPKVKAFVQEARIEMGGRWLWVVRFAMHDEALEGFGLPYEFRRC